MVCCRMPFSVTLRIDLYWQTIVDGITLLIYVSFISIFIGNSTTKHNGANDSCLLDVLDEITVNS